MKQPKALPQNRVYTYDEYVQALKNLVRYHRFNVMLYRSNLFVHYHRIRALMYFLQKDIMQAFPEFDFELAENMIMSHDDHELVHKQGDVQLIDKWKMSKEEKNQLKQEECDLHVKMVPMFPFKGPDYLKLLQRAHAKACIESQVMSLLDKIDGYCEAFHEVLLKNNCFLDPMVNYWARVFSRVMDEYPLLGPLVQKKEDDLSETFFDFRRPFELREGVLYKFNGSHTYKILQVDTGIIHYEIWKKVQASNRELLQSMITKKEKKETKFSALIQPAKLDLL